MTQVVADVERGWILTSDEQAAHLNALLKRGSKKEVNARTVLFCHFLCYFDWIIIVPTLSEAIPYLTEKCDPLSFESAVYHRKKKCVSM